MKRLLLILTIASVTLCQTVHAQYYSVNYDTRTVAAMVAAFGTEAVAEGYYREQVDDVLKHYTAAEVTHRSRKHGPCCACRPARPCCGGGSK